MSNATPTATTPAPAPVWLTVGDIVRDYTVCASAVSRWISRGIEGVRLQAKRVGGRWRIAPADLDAFFAALTDSALPPSPAPTPNRTARQTPAEMSRRDQRARDRLRDLGIN